jgi:hypothetical protein
MVIGIGWIVRLKRGFTVRRAGRLVGRDRGLQCGAARRRCHKRLAHSIDIIMQWQSELFHPSHIGRIATCLDMLSPYDASDLYPHNYRWRPHVE